MEKNELIIFKKCTDAPGTTRGFVYQYLKTLIVWLNNYRNGENISIFCEVDDDIKEINEVKTIRFTQLKCYSNVLGINSEEIKKSLYNFLYYQYFMKIMQWNVALKRILIFPKR